MKRIKPILFIIAALVAGFLLRGCFTAPEAPVFQTENTKPQTTTWTCSMHPQIKLPKAGKCPICLMDLIPLENSGEEGSERELVVSEHAAKLMDIQTTEVVRKRVSKTVRLVGKVDYDETRVSYITAWVAGRIDRLFVDYTGIPVSKGDHMVELYSPELLTAQEELIQAIRTAEKLEQSQSVTLRETADQTILAAREKLRLWGLTADQIKDIEKHEKPNDHITIYSPVGGIVLHKNAQEGLYVQTGTKIYTIADLSHLWVKLDAYESDLAWLRYGQAVEFTSEAYPGERFLGTIAFIDPILNQATRTVKIRVNVANAEMKLKPGMFIRATVHADMAAGGKVMAADLAGKWICPMHPEIVKENRGACDICEMPLVQAESLGYVDIDSADTGVPLVIPASAPLITGTRAIVYVALPDREKPTFEGRIVVLGQRAGDYYLVKEGLSEGDRVVTRGAFKIDAELQLQAKPNMMSPIEEDEPLRARTTYKAPAAFKQQVHALLEAYFSIQTALAHDNNSEAIAKGAIALEALQQVDRSLLDGEAHIAWMPYAESLKGLLEKISRSQDIDQTRHGFSALSEQLADVLQSFGAPAGIVYRLEGSMAFDNQGATWLQPHDDILNPYFGASMLKCGGVFEQIEAP